MKKNPFNCEAQSQMLSTGFLLGIFLLLNLSPLFIKLMHNRLRLQKVIILTMLLPLMLLAAPIKSQTKDQLGTENIVASLKWEKTGIQKRSYLSTVNSISSYLFIDSTRIAMLVTDLPAVHIFNTGLSKVTQTISLPEVPLVFSYIDGCFYVAGFNHLYIINHQGEILHKIPFTIPLEHPFAIETLVVKDKIALLNLADGSSWKITEAGLISCSDFLQVFSTGFLGSVERMNDNSIRYMVKSDVNKVEQTVELLQTQDASIATAKLIHVNTNQIWLDVEILTQSGIQRFVYLVDFDGNILNTSELPGIQSTYIPNQFASYGEAITYAVSAHDGLYFCLIDPETDRIRLPFDTSVRIHYSDSLLPYIFEEDTIAFNDSGMNIKAPITRAQIISNGTNYINHNWTARLANIWNNVYCGNKTIKTPTWVSVGTNNATPYCWGGNSTIAEFNSYLLQDKSAGDANSSTTYGAVPYCSVGVDCSGFVCRCFGLNSHYNTSGLKNITTVLPSLNSLQAGDILLKTGHVMLFSSYSNNGTINVIESVSGYFRVKYSNYSFSSLADYTPRYYNDVINEGLALNSSININPNPIVQYQGVTVTVNIKNSSSQSYNGSLAAAIHSTSGSFLGDIEVKTSVNISGNGSKSFSFSKSQITLNPGSYKIYLKSKPNGGSWTNIASGNYTNPVNVNISGGACNAPVGLYVSSITNTTARINWNLVTNAQSIQLQYKKSTASSWSTLTLPGNYYYYVLAGLTKNTNYNVRLKTICANGSSGYSTTVNFKTSNNKDANGVSNGINPDIASEVRVFPNPVEDILNIDMGVSPPSSTYLTLYSSLGKKAIQSSFTGQHHEVKLKELPAGVYMLSVDTNGLNLIKMKIIKK